MEKTSRPHVRLAALDTLWFQVGGTVCNLACSHCLVSASPTNHTHEMMTLAQVRPRLDEAARLGVKEYYFTGGEPFLNPEMESILAATLAVGPATVLTNGLLLQPERCARLAELADASDYSLDFRVSIDGYDAASNDPIRGEGTFVRILKGVRHLASAGLDPVVTVTEVCDGAGSRQGRERLLELLRDAGIERPRLKILPLFRIGAEAERGGAYEGWQRLREADAADGSWDHLQCSSCRMVTSRGVWVCPILVNEPAGRMGETLADTLEAFPLGLPGVLDVSRRGRELQDLTMADDTDSRRSRFPDHRGLATWGERRVPLAEFASEAAKHGRRLGADERREAIEAFRAIPEDATPVEGPYARVAVFGGVYNNHQALAALLDDASRRGAEALYCLGDLGGFGPSPEKVRPLLQQGGVRCIQGNYEQALGAGLEDCNCGYTDPRDNHFAAISFDYTAKRCSDEFRRWMARLPARRRIDVGGRELLLVHGSPRKINEFLFRSTCPVPFLDNLLEVSRADGILCTHTGLHWKRRLPSGRDVVNVGAIGRPANDGLTNVWYAIIAAGRSGVEVQLIPLDYDHRALADEMRAERLPEEFVETVLTGWWTTCLEILPAKERAASRY